MTFGRVLGVLANLRLIGLGCMELEGVLSATCTCCGADQPPCCSISALLPTSCMGHILTCFNLLCFPRGVKACRTVSDRQHQQRRQHGSTWQHWT